MCCVRRLHSWGHVRGESLTFVFLQFMEDRGYAEATLVSYVKMITGTIAVIVALYSHFNGGQFPETRDLVLGCVVVYFLCAGTINAASFVFEASAFYVGKLSARARQVNKGALALSVWVHSTIGTKGTSLYNVEFRRGARSKLDAVKFSKGYENYFTVEGRLLRDELRKDLGEALGKLGADAKKSR